MPEDWSSVGYISTGGWMLDWLMNVFVDRWRLIFSVVPDVTG